MFTPDQLLVFGMLVAVAVTCFAMLIPTDPALDQPLAEQDGQAEAQAATADAAQSEPRPPTRPPARRRSGPGVSGCRMGGRMGGRMGAQIPDPGTMRCMGNAERYFGLDGEMSGADIEDGHQLIQIGVAVDTDATGAALPTPELFCSLIGWPDEDLPWSARAEEVHGIPRSAVLAAPRASEVDDALYAWLVERGATAEARRGQVATGFNVGAFDFPFVRACLPRSASLFTRRYADLNPLCMALGSSVGALLGGGPSTAAWKRRAKNAGRELVAAVGRTEGEHDAGTDALIALGAWREFERTLAQLDREADGFRKAERARRKQPARN